ncbi:MAG: S1C family serine protease [Planctomycetota bacterium]|jgi:S1-C subfamily serine protease
MSRILPILTLAALTLAAAAPSGAEEGEGSADLVRLCRQVRSNVVAITAIRARSGGEDTLSRFSGIVIDGKGHIVTVADALRDDVRLRVRFLDGKVFEAVTVGFDKMTNVGVCRVDRDSLVPVRPGPLVTPPVGTRVVAVGNPFGLNHSVTMGIISGTDRTLARPGERLQHGFIQTTAPINPGDAGGLLADHEGRFVGMISSTFGRSPSFGRIRKMMEEMILKMNQDPEFKALLQDISKIFLGGLGGGSPQDLQKKLDALGKKMKEDFPRGPRSREGKHPGAMFGAQGINFALPAHRVLATARELIRHGKVVRGRIGVSVLSLRGSDYHRLKYEIPAEVDGVLVAVIEEKGPAGSAGVKRFDVIQALGDEKITDPVDMMEKIFSTSPGSRVKLDLWRRGVGKVEVEVVVALMK